MIVFFEPQKFKILSQISFSLVVCAFGVLCEKLLPNQGHEDFYAYVLSFVAITFWFMVYFELSFVHVVIRGPTSFFGLRISSYLSTSRKDYSFFIEISCLPVKNQLTINVRVFFWSRNTIPFS